MTARPLVFSGWIAACAMLAAVLTGACGKAPARQPSAGTQIICFGDSLTAGTGASEGMDYPSQLSRRIGRRVINAGVPGDTTADGLARIEADVLRQSPRLVLITLGGNDLKNRTPKDAAFENLRQIVTRIHDAGAVAIIGGIDIPLYGRGFGGGLQKAGRRYRRRAHRRHTSGHPGQSGPHERSHPSQRCRLHHHGRTLSRGDPAVFVVPPP